jgi:hypothetical protein
LRIRKWVSFGVVLAVFAGALSLAGTAPAKKRRLGNGPTAPARTPVNSTLPANKPLIVVQLRRGKVVGLAGTALPLGAKRGSRKPGAVLSALCSVNFTEHTTSANGKTTADWFGGIGCDTKMFLFGQAFLHESATKIDATGPQYQRIDSSAASGRNGSVIDAAHPSLYVRHLTNVYFSPGTNTGTIAVYPAKGQVLNGASFCRVAQAAGHGTGVHCELYTNRF